MAVTGGFFNSVSGDRKYSAEQINDYLEGLVGAGVYESVGGALWVSNVDGMKVNVSDGKLVDSKGHWLKNDSVLSLTIAPSDLILNRYDAIVARIDNNYSGRASSIIVKKGVPSSNPAKPSHERSEFAEEYILAYVYVKKGATSITQAEITDTRANTYVCGFVTGLVKQVDTSVLFLQYQTAYAQFLNELNTWKSQQKLAFDSWFSALTDELRINTYIKKYQSVYIITNVSTTIPINIADYDPTTDILMANINGVVLVETFDYTISGTGATAKIVLNSQVTPGNKISFTVLKSKIGTKTL